jgi:hypothetical protein
MSLTTLKACVVVDGALAPGHAANVAACIAAAFGAAQTGFAGTPLRDACGLCSLGSANLPIAILRSDRAGLNRLALAWAQRPDAGEGELVLFPAYAQAMHAAAEYHQQHAIRDHGSEPLLGIGLLGPAPAVRRCTGALPLLR